MYYIVETAKSPAQAATDLTEAVARNGFGLLHVHDLGTTLRSNGIAFAWFAVIVEIPDERCIIPAPKGLSHIRFTTAAW